MFDFWEQDLTAEQEEALLDKAARTILRRKLETPAIMALEMHKPLAYVGANAAVVFAPLLVSVLGYDAVHDYSRLFRNPQNVERLICKLETAPAKDEPAAAAQ